MVFAQVVFLRDVGHVLLCLTLLKNRPKLKGECGMLRGWYVKQGWAMSQVLNFWIFRWRKPISNEMTHHQQTSKSMSLFDRFFPKNP